MWFGSWYTAPIIDRVFKRSRSSDLAQSVDEICRFERILADDGPLLLKFWFTFRRSARATGSRPCRPTRRPVGA